jgi:phosphate transport system substrate-binding protein
MNRRNRLVGAGLALCILGTGAVWAQTGKTNITVDGSTTVGPIAKAFREHYKRLHPEVTISVGESGSGNGAKSLVNGTCDVATMSRFMKDNEWRVASEKTPPVQPVAHVVAVDGIAIVVHPSNPISGLTLQQVHDIYAGKINNWKELGGPDRNIVRISRDTNSGTFETFENLVMKGEKIDASTEKVGSNGAVRQGVQSTPAAIGYVGLGFVDRTLKALPVDGVDATPRTVAMGTYPIARPLFFFTNGYPKLGTHLHAFVTLHLTREGQEIIESIGFIPVTQYKLD